MSTEAQTRPTKRLDLTGPEIGGNPYRVEKLPGRFEKGDLAKRYNIVLSLDGPDVPKQIIMPVWCQDEIDVEEYLSQDHKPDSYLLMSGLLASPDQFDWPELSAIKNLTQAIREVRQSKAPDTAPIDYNPVFIGMAGPGFDGSEILSNDSKTKISPERVSVEVYNKMITQAEAKLKLGPEVAYVGHSAGAAANLLHKSLETKHNRKYVALHPAIQIDKATQFLFVKFLLNFIPYIQGIDKTFKSEIAPVLAKDVVRILNGYGYVGSVKTLADVFRFLAQTDFGKLPPQVQRQVNLHVEEIFKHLNAAIAKTIDLQRIHDRGENTRMGSLIITGEDDLITFVEDIQAEYGMISVFDGAHHDDFFTDPKLQKKYIDLIVKYLESGWTPESRNATQTGQYHKLTPTNLRRFLKFLGRILGKYDKSAKTSPFFNSKVD